MAGRADKGIIPTTGAFTAEARREASRDGVPPIELIDGEKLVDMLEQLELGLRPIKTHEVNQSRVLQGVRWGSMLRFVPFKIRK
jgi:restriction system protein